MNKLYRRFAWLNLIGLLLSGLLFAWLVCFVIDVLLHVTQGRKNPAV